MPNYLRLTDRLTKKSYEGRGLIEVDEKMCKAFHVPCDPDQFFRGWVDWWVFYMSDDWDKVRKTELETGFPVDTYEKRREVIDWLADNYNLAGYYMPR